MKKQNKSIDPLGKERDLTGKKLVRRRDVDKVVSGTALEPRNIKVHISIKLDADILEYFKEQARRPGAVPYQTQINQVLRDAIGRDRDAVPGEALLLDDRFVEALAERVRRRL